MADFLWISLIASIGLTLGINLVLWVFPGVGRVFSNWIRQQTQEQNEDELGRQRVRVIFPWKTMIVVSVLLTALLNLGLLRLA